LAGGYQGEPVGAGALKPFASDIQLLEAFAMLVEYGIAVK
jgi:hypothetical protein